MFQAITKPDAWRFVYFWVNWFLPLFCFSINFKSFLDFPHQVLSPTLTTAFWSEPFRKKVTLFLQLLLLQLTYPSSGKEQQICRKFCEVLLEGHLLAYIQHSNTAPIYANALGSRHTWTTLKVNGMGFLQTTLISVSYERLGMDSL